MKTYDITSRSLPETEGTVSILGHGIEESVMLTDVAQCLTLHCITHMGNRIWRRSCRVTIDGKALKAAIEYGRLGGWKLVIL